MTANADRGQRQGQAAAGGRRRRSVEGGNQRFRRPAALSPDGKRLAFVSTRRGGSDIYLIEVK